MGDFKFTSVDLTSDEGAPILCHMPVKPSSAQIIRAPFFEGESVVIIEPEGKRHVVKLRQGEKFHHIRTGHIAHDDIIGQPPGVLLPSVLDKPVICLRLTFEDYILKQLRRRTSIIHPKDLATLVTRGDLYPEARVLEAGIGSGAASVFLLRHLGPKGSLISYERRPEFIKQALANIEDARERFGDTGAAHSVFEKDVYEGIDENDLDLILLDVPEPHHCLPHAFDALRAGGTLLCWLPTVTQVYMLVLALKAIPGWTEIETRETLQRSWEVEENAMRPYHRMVGHTGFLIRARKVACPKGPIHYTRSKRRPKDNDDLDE
ncbi:MAG: tRNA (adenine-N1)-methyltransferase [Acidobacteriota bacterium]|nr:MAG: tRNA (adenine-N1)-methyltransferase [Acidobacteriota bacterium]